MERLAGEKIIKKNPKKGLTNQSPCDKIDTEREVRTMARSKTRGWYVFADGYTCWYHGLSAREKKYAIMEHGEIVKFSPTN